MCLPLSTGLFQLFLPLRLLSTSVSVLLSSRYPLVSLVEAGLSLSHPESQPSTHCPSMCSAGPAVLGAPREQVQLLGAWLRTCPWTAPGQALGGRARVSACPGLHGQVVAVSSVEAMGWLHGFRGLSLSPVTLLPGHSRTQKDLTGSQGCLCCPALEDISGGPAPASSALIIPRD